jgi:pimeloyl-ACP methyl ester carboxylesterase
MLLPLIQRLFALISLALLALGGYLVWSWWRLYEMAEPGYDFDTQPWRLWAGGLLLALSFLGRTPVTALLARKGDDAKRLDHPDGEVVETPNGARLHLHAEGPAEAPALIFVHGWGLDSSIWWEARRKLSRRYQVITYDLAGLGKSTQPRDGQYSLDRFADDLLTVVGQAGRRKVILVGHSIGGMTVLTYCQRHRETLGRQVAGIVLENTTPTDPTRTTVLGEALHAMQPVLRPLMKLDILLQPLVWAMNWQSYLSGSTHVAMRFGGFGARPTRAQLEQVARLATRNPPAVQAKGNLAMMNWEGAHHLPDVRIPALVFFGGKDIVTVPHAGQAIAWELRDGRPHPLQDAGHLGPLELADDYNAAIEAFADQVFTQGARWADAPVDAPVGAAEVVRLDPQSRTVRPFDAGDGSGVT